MMTRKQITNLCIYFQEPFNTQNRIFITHFSAAATLHSSDTQKLDTQLRSLCENPKKPQLVNAFALFNQNLDLGQIPSESTCNFLVVTFAKNKEYNLALMVYHEMRKVQVLPWFLSLAALIESFVHFQKPRLAIGVLGLIFKNGYKVNVYIVNVILKGLCENGMVVPYVVL